MPAQYKNKMAFNYMSQSSYATMMNFFGTQHGKRPYDGCAGHVKQKVASLVKSETVVVSSPEKFYEFCKKEIEEAPTQNGACEHFIQTFEFTQKLVRRPNVSKLTALPDTRKLHSLINASNKNIINFRYCLCCCDGCMHGGECTNNICPDAWQGLQYVQEMQGTHTPEKVELEQSPDM